MVNVECVFIGSAGRSKDSARQHTFVETETVRYVYQPIESLNIVVITTKGSNIIQDLETLRLISKIIPDYCQPISEETISEHVFELIFAFDEVITLGYKEDVSLPQIRTNLEMDSHEEKLHMMVRASKESEARDEGRRKAAAIRAAGQAADAGSMSKYGTYRLRLCRSKQGLRLPSWRGGNRIDWIWQYSVGVRLWAG